MEEAGRRKGKGVNNALHSTASSTAPLLVPASPLAVQRGSGKMVKYVVIRGAERWLLSYKGCVVPAGRI